MVAFGGTCADDTEGFELALFAAADPGGSSCNSAPLMESPLALDAKVVERAGFGDFVVLGPSAPSNVELAFFWTKEK